MPMVDNTSGLCSLGGWSCSHPVALALAVSAVPAALSPLLHVAQGSKRRLWLSELLLWPTEGIAPGRLCVLGWLPPVSRKDYTLLCDMQCVHVDA